MSENTKKARLVELKALFDEGLLTQAVYEQGQQNIINEIIPQQVQLGNLYKREKISIVGFDYPFMGRESFLKDVARMSYDNFINKGRSTSQLHSFGLIAGGSGIGKTRAGFEVSTIPKVILEESSSNNKDFVAAMMDPVYLYINLTNGAGYTKEIDQQPLSSIRIGTRVAYSSGMYKSADGNQFSCVQSFVSTNLNDFTLPKVLSSILKQKRLQQQHQQKQPIAVIIHIDEYQIYIQESCTSTGSNKDIGRELFKSMLWEIGIYMMTDKDNFIIPVCTGTTERDLSFLKTEFCKVAYGLLPLNRESCTPIIEHHTSLEGGEKIAEILKIDPDNFEICLADTGFIPKDISFLLQSCIISAQYGIACYDRLKALGVQEVSVDALETLCVLALTRGPVDLSTSLDKETTVDHLRQKGILYLIETTKGFHVFLSFYNLKAYLRRLPKVVIPDNLLFFPSKDVSWKWQDFELLFPYYQRCLFFAFDRLESGLTFSNVFRGAFGVDSLPTGFIYSFPTNVVYETESKFPGIADGKVMVNGTDITTTQSIFICSPNTEAIDQRWVVKIGTQTFIINSQTKHSFIDQGSDTKTISKVKVLEMATNFFKAMQPLTTPVIYMIVTNRSIDPSVIADFQALKDENKLHPLSPRRNRDSVVKVPTENHYLIIISEANFETFFTPTFAHRGLMARSSVIGDESDVFYSSQQMDTSF